VPRPIDVKVLQGEAFRSSDEPPGSFTLSNPDSIEMAREIEADEHSAADNRWSLQQRWSQSDPGRFHNWNGL